MQFLATAAGLFPYGSITGVTFLEITIESDPVDGHLFILVAQNKARQQLSDLSPMNLKAFSPVDFDRFISLGTKMTP